MKRINFTIVILIVLLTGCANKKEDIFLGCYALENGGKPEVEITKKEDVYFASIRERSAWSKEARLHIGTPEEVSELFGRDVRIGITSGVSNDQPSTGPTQSPISRHYVYAEGTR